MIAVMTFNKELNQEIIDNIQNCEIVEQVEDLKSNINKYHQVIIAANLDWTVRKLKSILKFIMDRETKIYYIINYEFKGEEAVLESLEISNLIYQPHVVEELSLLLKDNNPLFNDDDYENEALYMPQTIEDDKEQIEDGDISTLGIKETNQSEKTEMEVNSNTKQVQEVKKENAFKYLLNYILKLLSLFANVLIALLDNIQWLVITIAFTGLFYLLTQKLGIDTFPALIEEIMVWLNKLKAN